MGRNPVTDDRAQGELNPEEHDSAAGTGIDTTVPHSARIWNYWLGGKDNFAVDREAGDQFSAIYPGIVAIARADRAFLGRVIRYLAGEAGIRQFLDCRHRAADGRQHPSGRTGRRA
jgi:hypothetical protein